MTIRFFVQLVDPKNLPQTQADPITLKRILSLTFVTIGAIAVLMLVIGGLRYVFARSNPEKVTQAKNVIVYSLIGLVISASAAAIVNLVLGRVK